ncbi:MAG: NUDIX domain-containing protein [Candidatus Nanohalobium sp.]
MTTELAGNLMLRDRKILLLYREDEQHWEVPGGKVEENESPTEAAVREAEEEIGVKASLEKPFYSGEFQHNDEIFLWHCYRASIEGEPEIKEDRFEKLEWFEASELDDLELAPNIQMILPALRKL